ncbi:MAG: S1 family peptidase [Pseudomonadota bacterium]
MLRCFLTSLFLLVGATSTSAQSVGSDLISLEDRYATEGWEAVGRLDIGTFGQFCTATLIRDQLLLTAAHCVYNEAGDLRASNTMTFRAALRNGRAEATRDIIRVVPHPNFVPEDEGISRKNIATDIAVLELAQAIRLSSVQPFPISSRPRRGDEVAIVSYGMNRPEAPSLQKSCNILGRVEGTVVTNCDTEPGSSGSPVFKVENGRTAIVSVVSAGAPDNPTPITYGTSLQEPLRVLLAEFAARGPARPGGTQRLMLSGERNDTGARFVKVGE